MCKPHICRPLGKSSIRQIHWILSGAFKRAVAWDWIAVNPADRVEHPERPPDKPKPPARRSCVSTPAPRGGTSSSSPRRARRPRSACGGHAPRRRRDRRERRGARQAARKYFDDQQLAALITAIAVINASNRLNAIAGTPAGNISPASSPDASGEASHSPVASEVPAGSLPSR
jgi:hypothetical protein